MNTKFVGDFNGMLITIGEDSIDLYQLELENPYIHSHNEHLSHIT